MGCCQTLNVPESHHHASISERAPALGSQKPSLKSPKSKSVKSKSVKSDDMTMHKKSISNIFGRYSKVESPPASEPKNKTITSYVQIVSVFIKQKKVDGDFIDFSNQYTTWNDNLCSLDDDPASLLPPFETQQFGKWYWAERKWKESNDFVKINRGTRQKRFTRVAIFEKEYITEGSAQKEVVNLLRQMIWHSQFFNNCQRNEMEDYMSDELSDSLDESSGKLSKQNSSKSMDSCRTDESLSHPRLQPYKDLLFHLHSLADKTRELNGDFDDPNIIKKAKSRASNDFSSVQLDERTDKKDDVKYDEFDDDDDMETNPFKIVEKRKTLSKNGMRLNHLMDRELVDDEESSMDATPMPKSKPNEYEHVNNPIIGKVKRKKKKMLKNIDDDSEQSSDYDEDDDDDVEDKKDDVPEGGDYPVDVCDENFINQVQGSAITQQDLSSCQSTFEKLATKLKSVVFRQTKYSKSASKELLLWLNNFITVQLKLLFVTKLTQTDQEMLLFNMYLDILDVKEDVSYDQSMRESPFPKILQIMNNFEEFKNDRLMYDSLVCMDIHKQINQILAAIERNYDGISPANDNDSSASGDDMATTNLVHDTDIEDILNTDKSPNEEDLEAMYRNAKTDDDDEYKIKSDASNVIKTDDDGNTLVYGVYKDALISKVMDSRFAHTCLGINDNDEEALADIESIGLAKLYHNMVLKIHPDRNEDGRAREAFEKCQLAYEYLKIGEDHDFLNEKIEENPTLSVHRASISSGVSFTNKQRSRVKNDSISMAINQFSSKFNFKSSANGSVYGGDEDELFSCAQQVMAIIVKKLEAWLQDAHPYDANIVAYVMTYYKRCRLLEECLLKQKKLGDISVINKSIDINIVLELFMTKSLQRDYRRIRKKIDAFTKQRTHLMGHTQTSLYNDYFADVKSSLQDCIDHILATQKAQIFEIQPQRPMIKLFKLFYTDCIKILPELVSDIDSLMPPNLPESNPFFAPVVFILNKLSEFKVYCADKLKEFNMQEIDKFKQSLAEIAQFTRKELENRFEIWSEAACTDMARIVWRILKKYPRSADEVDEIDDLEKFKDETLSSAFVDSFSFLHSLMDNFFILLQTLPVQELKGVAKDGLKGFFNRLLRIILAFIDDSRPRFEDDEVYIRQLEENLKKKENINVNVVAPSIFFGDKEDEENSNVKKDNLEKDIFVDDNESFFGSNARNDDFFAEQMADETENELLKLGYTSKEINNAIKVRGCDIYYVLDHLLTREREYFMKIDKDNSECKRATNIIFGKKNKISRTQYEYIAIMIQQMDAVMTEIRKMKDNICDKMELLDDYIKPQMRTISSRFIESTKSWCDKWVDESIKLFGKQLYENEFDMKKQTYVNDFDLDGEDMQELMNELHKYTDIFICSEIRPDLYRKIIDSLCKQFCNTLLWIFLDPNSNRKYYRCWVENDKCENSAQKLVADKLIEDLKLLRDSFISEFGIDEDDFMENIKPIEQCYQLMKLTTIELIYKHRKRSSRVMISGPNGLFQTNRNRYNSIMTNRNEGLNDMLFGVIQHRRKSYAEEFAKAYLISIKTPITKELSDFNIIFMNTLNKFRVKEGITWPLKRGNAVVTDKPLFVEVISAFKLKNKRKFGGVSDCSINISCLDQNYHTKTISSNLNPTWKDEGFIFLIPRNFFKKKLKTVDLVVELKDKKHFMGMYIFKISNLKRCNGVNTVRLNGKNNNMLTDKEYGELKISINSDLLFSSDNEIQDYAFS